MWIWGEMANNCEIIYGNTLYTNTLLALYYLLLPPSWSDYRHHGRFYNSFLYFKHTSYTPYLAGSAAYLAGLITVHLLAYFYLHYFPNYTTITV